MLCSVHGFVYTPRRCANPSSSHHQSRGEGKEERRGPTALVAEYVTRRRRPRDGGACTVPLTTATRTHVRALTAERRGGTPRQDPGNECALQSRPLAGCSVPSPRRRSACTRARRQRYLAWPSPYPPPPHLGPAPASPSGWLWLLPKARRPAPPPPPFRFVAPPPRSGSRKNSSVPPPHLSWLASPVALLQGSTTRVPQYRAPAVRSSSDWKRKLGPDLTVTITRSSFRTAGAGASRPRLAPRARECYRSPRTGHSDLSLDWTGLDGGSFVRRGAAQRQA